MNLFPSMKNIFSMPSFSNVNLLLGQNQIQEVIITEVKRKKQIVYGARAMNEQLPLFFQRPTEDYDIYSKNPRQEANLIQGYLDRDIAGGENEFYSKPAIHKGTYRVMNVGEDNKRETEDDIVIADYTEMPLSLPVTMIEGIKYEKLSSIKKHKEQTIKDIKSKYRHEKDREDIERINYSEILRGDF